jgi:hypothetical protein
MEPNCCNQVAELANEVEPKKVPSFIDLQSELGRGQAGSLRAKQPKCLAAGMHLTSDSAAWAKQTAQLSGPCMGNDLEVASYLFLNLSYNSIRTMFKMAARTIGMASIHHFLETSMPKCQQAKRVTSTSMIPISTEMAARKR